MAVASHGGGRYTLSAAADEVPVARPCVRTIICENDSAADADFTFGDLDGTNTWQVHVPANDTKVVEFGTDGQWFHNGLEVTAIPATSTVTVFVR